MIYLIWKNIYSTHFMFPNNKYLLGSAPGHGARTVRTSRSMSTWTTQTNPATLEWIRCCGTWLEATTVLSGLLSDSASSMECKTAIIQLTRSFEAWARVSFTISLYSSASPINFIPSESSIPPARMIRNELRRRSCRAGENELLCPRDLDGPDDGCMEVSRGRP